MRVSSGIASAVRLLTVVPVGRADESDPVPYFTLVGWLYVATGAVLAAGTVAAGLAHGTGALLAAAVIVASWGILSGFIHWDGLADTADGFGVHGGAVRRLAVMRDSSIGAFGVVAIVMVALVQVAALAVVMDRAVWWALGAPVAGRWAAGVALWYRRPARSDGLAAHHARRPVPAAVLVLALPVLPLLCVPYPASAGQVLAVIGALLAGAVLPGLFVRRLGGITGDVLGTVVLLTETVMLVGGALAGARG